jgi:PAS domain S-box-containing protein
MEKGRLLMNEASSSPSGESSRLRYEQKLLALHNHALKLSSAKDIEQIVDYTLDSMELSLGFDYADITAVEEGYLCNQGSRGKEVGYEDLPLDGSGIIVKAAKTKQTVMALDTSTEPSYVDREGADWKGTPTMLSELAVPVMLNDEVWGILNVEDARVNAFTSDDKALLELLALHVASDIRRLKQNEALMTQARVLESMVEGVNVADDKGAIFYTNPAFEKMFGYESGELIGRHVSDLNAYPPEENALFINDIVEAMATKGAWRGEVHNRRKDGSEFYTSVSVTGLKLREKEHWISVQEDVTERKRTEEALRQRLRELDALEETVADLTRKRDLQGMLERIVERAARLLGATSGGMYICDADKQEARCVVSYNTPPNIVGAVLRFGEGAAGVVAVTAKPLIIDDYRTWPGRALVFERNQPFSSVLSVPMIWHGRVTGVIHVLGNNKSRRFTQADQRLLSMFANHATLAIESVRRNAA